MSIQSNFNQLFSIAGLLIAQSPGVAEMKERRIEGSKYQAKQEAAFETLKDMAGNVKKIESGKKTPYSETEVRDILNRTSSLTKDIYDAKVAAKSGKYKNYINENQFKQSQISPLVKEIERLPKVISAKNKALQSGQSRIIEKDASSRFIQAQNPKTQVMSGSDFFANPLKPEGKHE